MKAVSLRVRKVYFDQIVAGTKREELRKDSEFWRKRLWLSNPRIATFVCGKSVHRRWITGIGLDYPERVLGRPLSEQGKKDIPTEMCFVIYLGDEIKKD
jgi:hypothetical protein